ncbi:MAG TPA: DnaJ family domain-containing protein [Anaerolineales bacterium]|nr:DnaJ family domain-containing protein [Anaerolineales bacterium]
MSLLEQFERGIGRQIEQAQKDGAFDNLPGKGKPLKLNADPNADPERQAAYKLLNDNDFLLPWMEKSRRIEKDLEAARGDLSRTWDLVRSAGPSETWAEGEWARAREAFRVRIAAANKLIREYNLEIPSLRLERFILDAEKEIARIAATPAP